MGVIVGTAGHIDHGKSTLVKYLTGTDPDRLKEEKERGITIELGYVFMPLPDGGILSFIDVPGHERFVRQMVAGVATVDCFMLVVSADEGVMPQTREHLDVLELLDVTNGIVVLTKCDLVDEEMQQLAEVDVREYLSETRFRDAPLFRVSVETGQGMEELRTRLVQLAAETEMKNAGGRFRLDIDRVFVLRGFGTIVAGTAISGTVKVGDRLELQPGGGIYRVREMSVNHERKVGSGSAGDRIALNMVGLDADEVARGSCFAEPGYLTPRESLDTECTMLTSSRPLLRNQRVRLHTGTAEVMARAVPVASDILGAGSSDFVHFQLESPVVALPGDRFVIRMYSPIVTIGGGTILETGTRKVRKKFADNRHRHLLLLADGDLVSLAAEMIRDSAGEGFSLPELVSRSGVSEAEALDAVRGMKEDGTAELMKDGSLIRVVFRSDVDTSKQKVLDAVRFHHGHRPVSPGVPTSLPGRILSGRSSWFVRAVLAELEAEGSLKRTEDRLSLRDHPLEIPPELTDRVDEMIRGIDEVGLGGAASGDLDDAGIAESLLERGMLMELAPGILITSAAFEEVRIRASEAFGIDGFGLADLRDLLGVSRKIALMWAELLDSRGKTIRKGDRRFFPIRQ